MADKVEWIKKIKGVIQSKGGSVKGPNTPEDGSMRQSRSDGSLVSSRSPTCVLVPFFFVKLLVLAFVIIVLKIKDKTGQTGKN
jgi:hypothetical protein